jgi:hypothetical protein
VTDPAPQRDPGEVQWPRSSERRRHAENAEAMGYDTREEREMDLERER